MNNIANELKRLHKMAEKKNGVVLVCSFDDCGYSWAYGGDMKKATCPSCSRKIDVEDCRVDK
jgi:rubrerythrin